jgi:hypothetical protein
MALTYSEFATTGANLLVDLRTAILASTDWTQPNAGGSPNLLKATTTRGAQMVVDLNDTAPTVNRLGMGVYRTHDGTTGVDKVTRYLRYKAGGGTLSTMTLRCVVSASKEHLFINIEGPRGGESSADHATYGSQRTYFFMSDVVPYFEAPDDIAPCVAIGGRHVDGNASYDNGSYHLWVSRSRANTDAWLPCHVASLDNFRSDINVGIQRIAKNGDTFLSPYVVFEDVDGIRGRLSSLFFAGWNWTDRSDITTLPIGSKVTNNGITYKLLGTNKSEVSNRTYDVLGPVGNDNTTTMHRSPIVAVPCT